MSSDEFFDELSIQLSANRINPGNRTTAWMNILNSHDEVVCRVNRCGEVYRNVWRFCDSPVEHDIYFRVREIASCVKEYMDAMERAAPLQAEGLSDPYLLLSECGQTALAGMRTESGCMFVTWQWNPERTSVGLGHYWTSNYQGAKEDFAVRSGMVEEKRLFPREQLKHLDAVLTRYLEGSFEEYEIPNPRRINELAFLRFRIRAMYPEAELECQTERKAHDPELGYAVIREKEVHYYHDVKSNGNPGPYHDLARLCRDRKELMDMAAGGSPFLFRELSTVSQFIEELRGITHAARESLVVNGVLAFVKTEDERGGWLAFREKDGSWELMGKIRLEQWIKDAAPEEIQRQLDETANGGPSAGLMNLIPLDQEQGGSQMAGFLGTQYAP